MLFNYTLAVPESLASSTLAPSLFLAHVLLMLQEFSWPPCCKVPIFLMGCAVYMKERDRQGIDIIH